MQLQSTQPRATDCILHSMSYVALLHHTQLCFTIPLYLHFLFYSMKRLFYFRHLPNNVSISFRKSNHFVNYSFFSLAPAYLPKQNEGAELWFPTALLLGCCSLKSFVFRCVYLSNSPFTAPTPQHTYNNCSLSCSVFR